jgi:hypothetical protein
LTAVELVTDTDAAGPVAVFVTVCVLAGVVAVWVLVVVLGGADPDSVWLAVVLVSESDLAGAVALFTPAAAPEIAELAVCAALEAALLAEPPPHAVSGTVVIPSTSAPRTSGLWAAAVIRDRRARAAPNRLRVI